MRSHRLKRTDDMIRRIVSEALLTKVRDPRIGMVTVTGLEVSPEFDTAKVYVTVYGDETVRKESLEGLRSAAPFLQSEIQKSVRLRRIPKLRFLYDHSLERGLRVDATLRDLDEDEPAGDASPAPEEPRTDDDEGEGGADDPHDR